MSMHEQIRDVVKAGSKRTSLDSLKKQGFDNVKVVDFNKINELIYRAVEQVIGDRSTTMLDEEKQRAAGSAHLEFQKLLKEQQKAMRRAEQMEAAKAKLEQELTSAKQMFDAHDVSGALSTEKVKQIQGQLQKMHERQRTLLDKYHALDEEKRSKEAELVNLHLKVEHLTGEIERQRARGAAPPSAFIKEGQQLRDQRDDTVRRAALLSHFCRIVARNEYLLRQGRMVPPLPISGCGVQVLVGDKSTRRTGIKVSYEPGSNKPKVVFPAGEGPAPGPGGNGEK